MPSAVASASSAIGLGGGGGGVTGRGSILETVLDVGTLGLTSGQRAARAQGEIAQAQLQQQREDRDLALKYAEATPEELAQIQRGIQLNEADIQRKEKLLASSDPALIEAGKQALKLLRGEEAATLNPLRTGLDKQEQALRAKLQAQLGTGYENTTAGIQALQAFNEQKNASLSSAQENALSRVLGIAQNTSASYGTQNNIANTGALSGLFGNISNRRVSAINQTPITGAGAGFVGDLQGARANTDFINNILQTGASIAGAKSKNATA